MTEQPILYEDAVEITGKDLRYPFENPAGEGVQGRADLQVTAGTGLAVNVSSGTGWVRGRTIADQGMYRIRCSATKASSAFEAGGIPANSSGNPRVDQIIAKIYDDSADSSGQRKWRLEVLPGVATALADLNNRNGAIDPLPADCILLADVLVANGATSLTSTEIRDRRRFVLRSTIPPLLTAITAFGLEPAPPLHGERCEVIAADDLKQAAALMFLPRRATSLTRFRWKYAQSATALTGSYVLALYDSMGYLIDDTGSVAFAGAANTFKEEIRAFNAGGIELDGGYYWVLFGIDIGATGGIAFDGINTTLSATAGAHRPGPPTRNLLLRSSSGGLTPPATLLGMTDVGAATAAADSLPVPLVALSVGA